MVGCHFNDDDDDDDDVLGRGTCGLKLTLVNQKVERDRSIFRMRRDGQTQKYKGAGRDGESTAFNQSWYYGR